MRRQRLNCERTSRASRAAGASLRRPPADPDAGRCAAEGRGDGCGYRGGDACRGGGSGGGGGSGSGSGGGGSVSGGPSAGWLVWRGRVTGAPAPAAEGREAGGGRLAERLDGATESAGGRRRRPTFPSRPSGGGRHSRAARRPDTAARRAAAHAGRSPARCYGAHVIVPPNSLRRGGTGARISLQ
ncbi:loricrin-like [Schistocerca serialis cubense]|uniref:loricrin-like n=1 Tax=Schistocerca serialis cubense TaxID=2023355 RepID=UPI00214F42B0|nr:loricrin-like [Schistocerca serialis cubense]